MLSRSGKDKEGFSLFSLFDRTRSLPGRYRLKEWMSKPLYEKDMIWNRQNGVEMVLRPQNRDFISDTTKLLRHVHDIPRLLMKFKKGEASLSDWFKLYTTLEKGLSIMDLITSFVRDATDCNHHAADKEYLSNLISNFDFHAPCDIFHTLQVAIDFDSSGSEGHAVIKDGYDACLDQHRNIFDSLELRLTKACHQVLQVVPLLQNVSVEYVSQVGIRKSRSSISPFVQNCDFFLLLCNQIFMYTYIPIDWISCCGFGRRKPLSGSVHCLYL